jgi:glutamyl-tRNA reductase
MVDIAVPRDVEPEVGDLDDVYLYTVDHLEEVIQENLNSRREAADQADDLIQAQVENFMAWMRSLDAVDVICAYRDRADMQRQTALTKAYNMLNHGKPAEEVLHYLAHTLTNKLTHDATHSLNQAGRDGRRDLLSAARFLLNLPSKTK